MINKQMDRESNRNEDGCFFLCKNRGKVYSADELFQTIWGEKYFKNSRNTVMVQIRHIREKLNDIGEKPKFIKTIWGVGYTVE